MKGCKKNEGKKSIANLLNVVSAFNLSIFAILHSHVQCTSDTSYLQICFDGGFQINKLFWFMPSCSGLK